MIEIRSYKQACEYLGKKDSRPLRYKTRVNRRGENIAITHHETDIITYQPSGSVIIDTQGWHTSTTKDRLNNHLPIEFYIWQHDSVWYINKKNQPHLVFADGIRILPDGTIRGVGPPIEELKKLNKEILKYSRNYIEALFAGKVRKPGPGDCWDCSMRIHSTLTDGRSLGEMTRTDHLLSHFDEQYYVPSLLVRAIEVFPVSQAAKWALEGLWGVPNPAQTTGYYGFAEGVAKQQLRSSLRRYLRRQLGLAS